MWSRTEKISLLFGWIALGLGIAGGLLLRNGFFYRRQGGTRCYFRRVTGLYCPGCGLTRAAYALTKGRIVRSFLSHPCLLFFVIVFLFWLILMSVRFIRSLWLSEKKRFVIWEKNREFYARLEVVCYVFAGLLITQWLVKFLLQVIWHLDWFKLIG